MRTVTVSGLIFVCAAFGSVASVAAGEFEELRNCFRSNVTNLEPYQDNMLDLAEIIFATTCDQKKKSFFNSREPRDEETLNFHVSMMKILVQQMVVEARADRLSIQLN